MNISMVGCGLLGSMAASPLAAYSVALAIPLRVKLFDHDVVEKRNSPANLGVPGTIGKKKVDVVGELLEASGVDVERVPFKLTPGNVWMLQDSDMILGATDNIAARQTIQRAAQEYGVPYIDMGISEVSGIVSWTNGEYTNMPYAGDEDDTMPGVEKQPACALIASRLASAVVTECAVRSMFIYTSAHDPANVVWGLRSREAKNGDMVTWHIVLGGGEASARPYFFGNLNDVEEDSDEQ